MSGQYAGVVLVADGEQPPAADVAIGVQTKVGPDVDASRLVQWSHAAQWPTTGEADAIVAVSDYHRALLRERLHSARIEVIPAGVDLPPLTSRNRDRFLYTSSPDRGLHRLLAMWPRFWERWHLPLSIGYDVRGVLSRRSGQAGPLGERLREIRPLLDQPGVVLHPYLTEQELIGLRNRSFALLYPLDPVLPHSELYALAVLEACAAGCPPVLAPVDAFPSVYGKAADFVGQGGADYDADAWMAVIQGVMDAGEGRRDHVRGFAQTKPWNTFVEAWVVLLRGLVGTTSARARRWRAADANAGQDWLAIVSGEGRGEAGVLRPLVLAARSRGHRVTILADSEENAHLAGGSDEDSGTLVSRDLDVSVCGTYRPSRVVVSTSASVFPRCPGLTALGTPIVSLEHTWPEWLSASGGRPLARVLVALPSAVFANGISGSEPVFRVSAELRSRIRCVGTLLGASQTSGGTSRSLLLYLGRSPGWLHALAPALSLALNELREELDISADYICEDDQLDLPRWVQRVRPLTPDAFAKAVAEAAAVVGHSAIGTWHCARVVGVPLLHLLPGRVYTTEPACPGDRFSHVLQQCDEVEVVHGIAPSEVYRDLLRQMIVEGRRPRHQVDSTYAVDCIERLEEAPEQPSWRPNELRP